MDKHYENRWFKMPNGETTKDSKKYIDAWRKVSDMVLEFFPGYESTGWDPGIHLAKMKIIDGKYTSHEDSLVLSLTACRALLSTKGYKIE